MIKVTKKILIVEDERPLAHALEAQLGRSGFECKIAFNGEEALSMILEEHFDLMLLDLVMPVKDGFSVLQELKDKGTKIPIIVLTNLGQEEDYKRVKELGALEYFVKANTPIMTIVEKVKAFPFMK